MPQALRTPPARRTRRASSAAPTRVDGVHQDAQLARREPIDWDALEPAGLYARHGRRVLELALVVAVCAPVLALVAVLALVNLIAFRDPRKVFYVQPRVGQRGRIFQIYKFRTMREPQRSAHDSWSSGEDHARVTRLGTWLRNTHLDELPQFWNILRGEMSFIGPRPEMVEVEQWAQQHVPGFTQRLVLRPGITGWAQITQGYTGRSVEAYAQKLEITNFHARRLSLRSDLEVLARTFVWMLRGRGWQWNQRREPVRRVKLALAARRRIVGRNAR